MLQIIGFLFWFTLFLFGMVFLALIIRAIYWTIENARLNKRLDEYDRNGIIFFLLLGIIDVLITLLAFNNIFIK